MNPYRSLLVISLDEEETLWQMLDDALELSMRDPVRANELATFVWEEARHRSARDLSLAATELLSILWGPAVTLPEVP